MRLRAMPAKIAYCIQLHEDPEQFRWLFSTIYNAQDVFAIHIDQKTPAPVYDEFRRIIGTRPNLLELPRQAIFWGCRSCAMVPLRAMRRLLSFDVEWAHFVNISGRCFPLKPRAGLIDLLASDPAVNFVDIGLKVVESPMLQHRIAWSFTESIGAENPILFSGRGIPGRNARTDVAPQQPISNQDWSMPMGTGMDTGSIPSRNIDDAAFGSARPECMRICSQVRPCDRRRHSRFTRGG